MIKDFFDGFTAYAKAFTVMNEMRLWKYAILPAIISILICGGIAFTAWGLSDNIGNWALSWYPWEWGSVAIQSISAWLGAILIVISGLILFKYIVLIISAPFMSFLSEKVENKLRGNHVSTRFSFGKAVSDVVRGIRISLRNIIREIFYTLLLLLLGLIPAIGIVSPFLIFAVQAFYAGFGNMDYTLERHFSHSKSIRFVKDYKGLALGNGTVFMLLLMTGVGFLYRIHT